MQWHSVKSKKLASLLIIACFIPSVPSALEEDRLWLPTKYSTLFLDLKKAALAAENLDRCVSVLRGTIDTDQSKAEHPIYRILCRQENGKSYNEMVDGVSFKTLTTKIITKVDDEKRKAEERKARINSLWTTCEKRLSDKIRLMEGLTWITEFPPEPTSIDENSAQFIVDFDAKDVYGNPLKYRANCNFTSGDVLSLRILGRKDKSDP